MSKNFLSGQKSNFNYQNRGYFVKKMFRICVETSVINSLGGGNSPYFAKKFQKYSEVKKKSNFNFQNRGFFGKKKSKSQHVAGTFF